MRCGVVVLVRNPKKKPPQVDHKTAFFPLAQHAYVHHNCLFIADSLTSEIKHKFSVFDEEVHRFL